MASEFAFIQVIDEEANPAQTIDRGLPHDDLSQASVRLGQPALVFAYSPAALSIDGMIVSSIGSIQPDALVHLAPSHWARYMPLFIMIGAARWIGAAKPSIALSFQRQSVMLSASTNGF